MNRLIKFCRLERSEKLLLCESLSLHLSVGLLLKIVPFRMIPRIFTSKQLEAPAKGGVQTRHNVTDQQLTVIENIREAVQRAGWVSPWKNKCLVSSLAGRCMLRRRKIQSQISLGVIKDGNGRMIAHAWLRAGDLEIVTRGGDYQVLYVF